MDYCGGVGDVELSGVQTSKAMRQLGVHSGGIYQGEVR
jgi:hypothetical protein